MKVSLPISAFTLELIVDEIGPNKDLKSAFRCNTDMQYRFYAALSFRVVKKLQDKYFHKCIPVAPSKPFKLTLEYFEAYVLLNMLKLMELNEKAHQAILNKFILQLDQKLQ